ncbi:hypothetical protein PHMEG_0005375 [Phytophthora megakarya]|uniref:Uncharacterized protein n=1 Tax=Phytophthora megakarya TaxID=4795 RepID=A0A225WRD4_9STRA|nr:hypothetical protein PHMEG_0005375 [Phytophthora megakarya]
MTGPRHAQKKAGREDGGREDESLRRSRRKQGLPPLEYNDLDVVVRESRATKKAAQDAERAVAQDQPVSEPAAGDDQALSNVASPEAPLSESGTTRVEGESTRDESAQASVGGADMVGPPVEEVTPKPGQDVDVEPLEEKAPPVVKIPDSDVESDSNDNLVGDGKRVIGSSNGVEAVSTKDIDCTPADVLIDSGDVAGVIDFRVLKRIGRADTPFRSCESMLNDVTSHNMSAKLVVDLPLCLLDHWRWIDRS